MSTVIARMALIAVVIAFAGGVWVGHGWGESSQADEVNDLNDQVATLTQERDDARSAASSSANVTASLRDSLKSERESRLAQQKAAAAELSARDDRIAKLERQAATRRQALADKVKADENCTALRTLPVCAALARGLWGELPAADPH